MYYFEMLLSLTHDGIVGGMGGCHLYLYTEMIDHVDVVQYDHDAWSCICH